MKPHSWLFFLVWLAGSVMAQERYEIRFDRPAQAGDKFQLTGRIAYQSKFTVTSDTEGEKPRDTERSCKWSGELEVLGVTPKGLWKELRFTVREIEINEEGRPSDRLKAGDVLRVKKGEWNDTVAVNDQETKDHLTKSFAFWICPVVSDHFTTMDEAFGSAEKKAVGDTWEGNQEGLMGQFSDHLPGLKPGDISGRTKLVGETTIAGQPALRLASECKLENPSVRPLGIPFGMMSKKQLLQMRGQYDVPIDPDSKALHLTISSRVESHVVSPFGSIRAFDDKSQIALEVTLLPIP